MNMNMHILFLSFSCILWLNTLPQWNMYNPQPTDRDLFCTFFCDSLHGWAVGEDGIILESDGESWLVKESPTTEKLRAVFFTDNSHGWAAGYSGTILKYENEVWSIQNSSTVKDIYSLYFFDTSHGWAVGHNGLILSYNGTSWTLQSTPTNFTLRSVWFTDTVNGWAFGNEGKILRHDKNGWAEYPTVTYEGLKAVCFTDETHGWAVGDNGMILFFNGNSWIQQTSNTTNTLRSVSFLDDMNGWAVSDYEIMFWNGYEWEVQYEPYYPIYTYSVHLTYYNFGAAVGLGGKILKFDGINWIQQNYDLGVVGHCLSFLNSSCGWSFESTNEMLFYDGLDWTIQNFNNNNQTICSAHFLNENLGWVAGYWGTIYKYESGNWVSQSLNVTSDIYGICMCNDALGWACSNKIYKYNGTEWLEAFNSNCRFNSIFFTDFTHGWAVGGTNFTFTAGYIYRYNGESWYLDYELPGTELRDAYFIDSIFGWAVGDVGTILRYDGTSWTQQPSLTYDHLNAIYFTDNNHGWACGDYGTILHFYNNEWKLQNSGIHTALMDIFFTDSLNGWAVGGTTMLYTTNGGSIFTSFPGTERIADSPGILIYPNPIKDFANLSYILDQDTRVRITIYDLQGRFIRESVCELQSKGKHDIKISIIDFPKGVYLIIFTAFELSRTHKIVKIN